MNLHHGCRVQVDGLQGILANPSLLLPKRVMGESKDPLFPLGWTWGLVLWDRYWADIKTMDQLNALAKTDYFREFDDSMFSLSLQLPTEQTVGIVYLRKLQVIGSLQKPARRRGKRHKLRMAVINLEDL